MIKIDSSLMIKNKESFYKTVSPAFLNILRSIKPGMLKGYDKLLSYFDDGNGGIDETKVKRLILGDKTTLDDAIKKIGVIKNSVINKGKLPNIASAYSSFTKTDFSREWPQIIGVESCPYCNRTYIYTLSKDNVRPDYDHYFPKSKYPYLCVSMFNLVPSCKQCNQLKSSQYRDIIYPYDEEFGNDGFFEIDIAKIKDITSLINPSSKFEIKLNVVQGTKLEKKIKYSDKMFRLEKLYSKHTDYVKDLIKLSRIYKPEFIKSLESTFKWFNGDLKDILYLTKFNSNEFHKRTLSKFTSDIIKQLEGK